MPSQTCYIPGCRNGYTLNHKGKKTGFQPVSLFRPPQDMIEKWSAIIQRKDRKLRKDDIICALHFREEDIEHYYSHVIDGEKVLLKRGYPKLKPGTLPCIFKIEKGMDKKVLRRYNEGYRLQAKEEEKSLTQENSGLSNKYGWKKTSSHDKCKRNKIIRHKQQETELSFKDEVTSVTKYMEIDVAGLDNDKTYISKHELYKNSQKCEKSNHNVELSFKEETTILKESSFTYEELIENVSSIQLPSPLWAIHRHPRNRFVTFSHTILNPDTGVKFDKGVTFECSCTPIIIFHGHHVPIPQLSKDVTSLNDVCKLLSELEEFRAVCLLSENPHNIVIALEN